MIVKIYFDRSSMPIGINAQSTYQKGDMFCVGYETSEGKEVDKYPIRNIFKVNESHFESSQPKQAKL